MRRLLAAAVLTVLFSVFAAAQSLQEADLTVQRLVPLRMGHFKVVTSKGAYSVWLDFEDGEERFERIAAPGSGRTVRVRLERATTPGVKGHIVEIRFNEQALETDKLSSAAPGQ